MSARGTEARLLELPVLFEDEEAGAGVARAVRAAGRAAGGGQAIDHRRAGDGRAVVRLCSLTERAMLAIGKTW